MKSDNSKNGGNLFVNVAELSVPFGLLFALKAYQDTKKTKTKTKSMKGGECLACNKHGGSLSRQKIQEDILSITSDLSAMLKNSRMAR